MPRDYFLDSVQNVYIAFKSLIKTLKKTYTVMLIPHNHEDIRKVNTSMFVIVLFITIMMACAMTILVASSESVGRSARVKNLSVQLLDKSEEVDKLKLEIHEFTSQSRELKRTLDNILQKPSIVETVSDLSLIRSNDDEILRSFSKTIQSTNASLQEASDLVSHKNVVYENTPHLWPIKNGEGHVSMAFGQNINPFSGEWYLHSGLDISTYSIGNLIVSTGNGRVFQAGYEQRSLGNYVTIKHPYGYYSVYGHLQKILVHVGQLVGAGEAIGVLGNTGLTTGPHLHYEVVIGHAVIDPMGFLNEQNRKSNY